MKITLLGILVVVGTVVLLVLVLDRLGRKLDSNKRNGNEQPNDNPS